MDDAPPSPLAHRIGERIADEVEKVAAGRQSNCERAVQDILVMVATRTLELEKDLQTALSEAMNYAREAGTVSGRLTVSEVRLAEAVKIFEDQLEAERRLDADGFDAVMERVLPFLAKLKEPSNG